jgi:hypothetical protein
MTGRLAANTARPNRSVSSPPTRGADGRGWPARAEEAEYRAPVGRRLISRDATSRNGGGPRCHWMRATPRVRFADEQPEHAANAGNRLTSARLWPMRSASPGA